MASGKKNYELEIMISGGTDASLAASINKARKEISSLERQAGMSVRGIEESFGGMNVKGIDALGKMSDKVFGVIAKGSKYAAAGIAGIMGASAFVGAGFEAQMSTVAAISGATESDMKRLNDLAEEMGRTTQFSAKEAGQGLEYMAMAGWKTEDMIDGLPGIMNLAAASGEDLGSVSDIVTDALTAFGLEASDAEHFSDVLAQASSNANTNVGMMGETFKYVGPVAGALGYSIEDTAVAIGLMANSGIKASQAGTSLRKIFLGLQGGVELTGKELGKYHLEIENADGSMRELDEVMGDLRQAFSLMTDAEKTANAENIAGKTGMAGLLAIVNAGEDDYNKLTEAIENSAGASERMAEIRLDNLVGDLTLLKSAAEGAGIEIYRGFSANLRGLTKGVTAWITSFTGELETNIPTIQRQIKVFGRNVQEGFEPVIDFGKWCLNHPGVIKGTLAGIVAAMGTFKAAQTAKNGVMLLKTLSGMMSAWPVAAFGVAAGAIAGITAAVRENNRRLKKEDLDKRFGTIRLSMEQLDQTAKQIIDNGNMKKVGLAVSELGKVGDLADEFEEASKELDKLSWKVGVGIELDMEDKEMYSSSIDQMVKNSIAVVEQARYTATISVQALFGTDSEAGNELIAGFDQMYKDINDEVGALGLQLGSAYSHAIEDGVIDIDEAKTIQELQKKLAAITQQVSQAQFNAKLQRIGAQYSGRDLDPDTFKNLQEEIRAELAGQAEANDQAMEWALANVELRLSRGEIGKVEYEREIQQVLNQASDQKFEMELKGLSFSTKSIVSAYQDSISEAVPGMKSGLDSAMQDTIDAMAEGNSLLAWDSETIRKALGFDQMNKEARENITDLWEGMQPEFEEMQATAQSYLEKGKEIPQSVADGLADASVLGAIAGNKEAIWQLMALTAKNNPEYEKAIQEARESGVKIPEEVALYLDNGGPQVLDAIDRVYNMAQTELDDKFGNMEVHGRIKVNYALQTPYTKRKMQSTDLWDIQTLEGHADGGIFDTPHIAWFAEEGPEAVVPLDGSRRSVELWQETGRLLGAYEENNFNKMNESLISSGSITENKSSSSIAPVFSPVINVEGGANVREQVMDGLREGYDQFVEYMEQYKLEQYRVSF